MKTKLAKDRFDEYIAANPLLLKVNQLAAMKKEREEQARKEAE